jgi:hypothetical protein
MVLLAGDRSHQNVALLEVNGSWPQIPMVFGTSVPIIAKCVVGGARKGTQESRGS